MDKKEETVFGMESLSRALAVLDRQIKPCHSLLTTFLVFQS